MARPTFHTTYYKRRMALIMVVTGVVYTIISKCWSQLSFRSTHDRKELFSHVYSQMLAAFFGKALCLLIFKILCYSKDEFFQSLTSSDNNFTPYALLPPVLCEIFAILITYIGITLLSVNNPQMSETSLVFFVVLMSICFLRKEIRAKEWLALFIIIITTGAVGGINILYEYDSKHSEYIITGNVLINIAQFVVACQLVYEEKYMTDYGISPLQVVGWEGLLGFIIMTSLLILFYWSCPPTDATMEDIIEIGHNPMMILATLLTTLSITIYSFAAVSISKEMSAIARVVLETFRIPIVWMIYVFVEWQDFEWIYLFGFTVIIIGICIYISVFSYMTEQSNNEIEAGDEIDRLRPHEVIRKPGSLVHVDFRI